MGDWSGSVVRSVCCACGMTVVVGGRGRGEKIAAPFPADGGKEQKSGREKTCELGETMRATSFKLSVTSG